MTQASDGPGGDATAALSDLIILVGRLSARMPEDVAGELSEAINHGVLQRLPAGAGMTPASPDPARDPEALAGAEEWLRNAAVNPTPAVLLAEYERRGERLKTLELGLLAALMPGLDPATKDQLGRKMRELIGLDENREPI